MNIYCLKDVKSGLHHSMCCAIDDKNAVSSITDNIYTMLSNSDLKVSAFLDSLCSSVICRVGSFDATTGILTSDYCVLTAENYDNFLNVYLEQHPEAKKKEVNSND